MTVKCNTIYHLSVSAKTGVCLFVFFTHLLLLYSFSKTIHAEIHLESIVSVGRGFIQRLLHVLSLQKNVCICLPAAALPPM